MLVQEQLRLDQEGFALLRARLRDAGGDDPDFDARFGRLMDVLHTILDRLSGELGDEIEQVMAVGAWALDGIDLRTLPYDDIIIEIVLRSAARPFDLYCRIAERVFDGLHDEDIFVQFDIETLPTWQRAKELAQANGVTVERAQRILTALGEEVVITVVPKVSSVEQPLYAAVAAGG